MVSCCDCLMRMGIDMNTEQERANFEAWLRVKPCGAAHDFAWEAWRARAALQSQDREDAERWRTLMGCNKDAAIQILRRIEPAERHKDPGVYYTLLEWVDAIRAAAKGE